MSDSHTPLDAAPNPLEDRVDEIRGKLAKEDPNALALRAGAIFTPEGDAGGEFRLLYWSREVILRFPAFIGKYADDSSPISTFDLTMLAYYFEITDGTPMAGKWIAFNQLPDGKFYAQAFQGYTGDVLARAFSNDADAFIEVNERLFGRREFFGNLAYSYQVLPRVPLLVVCWLGDEDFPPSYRILFDANASHHLTTDAYAILGSRLTRMLVKMVAS
jgi:hypothetical protein